MANPKPIGFNFGPELGPVSIGPTLTPVKSKLITEWVPSSPLDPGHWETHAEADDFDPHDQANPNPVLPPRWGEVRGGGGTGAGDEYSWLRYPIRYIPPGRRPVPVIDCDDLKVPQILEAFLRAIKSPCFDCLPELRNCMIRNWESQEIVITCYREDQHPCNKGKDAETQFGIPSGFTIALCDRIWYDPSKLERYLTDVLIHEMAHVCMEGLGTEIEALAVEYLCNRKSETPPPIEDDWIEFFAESGVGFVDNPNIIQLRVGQYIALDPITGTVWAINPNNKRIRNKCFQDNRLIRD